MSLDIGVLQQELEAINAERETANERIRLFSQRGRGRGRGRGFPSGGRGQPEAAGPATGDRAARSEQGGITGPRDQSNNFSKRGGYGDRRDSFGFHDRREPSHIDRYQPPREEPAEEEALPGSNKGRLASAIVVDPSHQEEELGTARRPQENGHANPALKQRNKRLFGSLVSTLQKFKEEDQRFKRTKLAQSRAEAEQRAEQRALEETELLREKQRQDLAKARVAEINRKKELDAKLRAKEQQILMAHKIERELKLGGWLKTAAHPPVLWLPKLHSEDTQLLLEQRQTDLDAWKEAQLAKMEAETAQIEASFKPIVRPEVQQTGGNPPPAAAEVEEQPETTADVKPAEATEEPDLARYEAAAADEGNDLGEEPEDDLNPSYEMTGVKDLLR